jgi:hypothetical protein
MRSAPSFSLLHLDLDPDLIQRQSDLITKACLVFTVPIFLTTR